jgi:hypothetical protein
MSADRTVMPKERIGLLFNALVELGYERNLEISAPMLGDPVLFKAAMEGARVRISDVIHRGTYERKRGKLVERMKARAANGVPEYGDWVQALYQSGILRPSGLEQLEEILALLRRQTVVRGGDVYHVALDTNLLLDRFFSVYLRRLPPHPNLDYVLCETVRDELKNRRDKLKKEDIRNMAPLDSGLLRECFLNQNELEDRRRYIGFLEYTRMREATSCPEIDAPSSRRSGMENDRYILKAYGDFVRVGRKVVFVSRDNEAIRMMTGEEGVIPVLLRHPPYDGGDRTADWPAFVNFLYLLGVLFGCVGVSVSGVPVAAIYGVWSAKDAASWESDAIRVGLARPSPGEVEDMREFEFVRDRILRHSAALDALGA